MARKSGLQKRVLALYRQALAVAKAKDRVDNQEFVAFVRAEFRRQAAAVPRKDFQRVEYLIRKGEKQLAVLGDAHVQGVHVAHVVDDGVGVASPPATPKAAGSREAPE